MDAASLEVWLNETEVDVVEVGSGVYTVTLGADFTNTHVGTYNIELDARKAGHDSLKLVIEDFLLIRPFPWLAIGLVGGGIAVIAIGWYVLRRRRGDSFSYKREKSSRSKPQGKSKEEKRQQKEKDGKFDPKEFFDV